MKKNLFFIALLGLAVFSLTSCRKDPEEVVALLTDSEAVEILEDAIASKTSGMTAPTIEASELVGAYIENCNVPGDTTFANTKSVGAVTHDYDYSLDWLVSCENLVPQSAAVGINGAGEFTSLHWDGLNTIEGDLVFTGLSPSQTEYIVNGSYDQVGNLTGSVRQRNPTFSCTVAMSLDNLTLNKTTQRFTGGSGDATVTANAANGETKTISGTFVFNADGTVTITLSTGHSHTFEW